MANAYSNMTYLRYPVLFTLILGGGAVAFYHRKTLIGDLQESRKVFTATEDLEGRKLLQSHMKYK